MDKSHFGWAFGKIDRSIKRQIDNLTSELGITAIQGRIIGFIYYNSDRAIYQKTLEDEFNLRKSSITSVLNNLEKSGFIKREAVLDDQRLKHIVLTPKALLIQNEIEKRVSDVEDKTFDCLSDDEKESLNFILEKILKNIK